MEENKKTAVWKVRTIKDYPDAHNHVFVGVVKSITNNYVRMMCKTFHYGRTINAIKDIREGNFEMRIIPWNRIEVINELSGEFDVENSRLSIDSDGGTRLYSGDLVCVISSSLGERY